MPKPPKNLSLFQSLVEVVNHLRGPDGCPWDREQNHQSLAPFALEEAYEVVDAIESRSDQDLKEELGDLLFQVILHSQLASERKAFQIEDVIESINSKIIRRHPHVFSDAKLDTPKEVEQNWQKIKAIEKSEKGTKENTSFSSIPKNIPALQRSQKIGHKSIRFNFDWSDVNDVIAKIEEELAEVKEALALKQDKEMLTLEIGDLLFTVSQLARHLDIDAEQALRKTLRKFEIRFELMKKLVEDEGLDFKNLNVSLLEEYWQKAKGQLQ